MDKIELKCSHCGGVLQQVETKKDTYICLHCGSQEIIKDTDKHSSTSNYYVNQNITKNIYGAEKEYSEEDFFKLISNAEKFIEAEEYKYALKLVKQAQDIDMGHYKVWWLSCKAKLLYNIRKKSSGTLTLLYSQTDYAKDYKKAIAFADDSIKDTIAKEYADLCAEYDNIKDIEVAGKHIKDIEVSGKPKYLENYIRKYLENRIRIHIRILYAFLMLPTVLLVSGIVFPLTITISETDYSLYIKCIVSIFFFILAITLYVGLIIAIYNLKKDERIVDYITKHTEVSIGEIESYMQEEVKIHSNSVREKIEQYIEKGYLYEYTLKDDTLIRIKHEEE